MGSNSYTRGRDRKKGLIWSPRRGQLDFTVPLFAEYLRDNHPITSFEEE